MLTPVPKAKRNERVKETQGIFTPMCKRLYTIKEAAGYLGRSVWSVRELIWAGRIPYVRREGGRKYFLDIEDLNNLIKREKSSYL